MFRQRSRAPAVAVVEAPTIIAHGVHDVCLVSVQFLDLSEDANEGVRAFLVNPRRFDPFPVVEHGDRECDRDQIEFPWGAVKVNHALVVRFRPRVVLRHQVPQVLVASRNRLQAPPSVRRGSNVFLQFDDLLGSHILVLFRRGDAFAEICGSGNTGGINPTLLDNRDGSIGKSCGCGGGHAGRDACDSNNGEDGLHGCEGESFER